MTPRPDRRRSARGRRGFSYLETVVAFVLLGLSLAGTCPIIVMQVKLSRRIARGSNPQTAYFRPVDPKAAANPTFYLVPPDDRWQRKLGVGASVRTDAPSPSARPSIPSYDVTVTAPPVKSLGSESVTVHVSLVKHPAEGETP